MNKELPPQGTCRETGPSAVFTTPQERLRGTTESPVSDIPTPAVIDKREVIVVLRLAEAYVGAAIAQGTLVNCAMPPEVALDRISDLRKRMEMI